jgi:hypothetical protein
VLEAQCECAAGMGPHAQCKHVCTILHALVMFGEKKTSITEETCTKKLQSFHQVKSFNGSPLKVSHLKLSTDDSRVFKFDPQS